MQHIDAAQQNRYPRVPCHQTKYNLAARANDLTGYPHERIQERFELWRQRPPSGSSKANHAFSVHASDAITM